MPDRSLFKLPTKPGSQLMVAVLGVDSSRERASREQSEIDRLELARAARPGRQRSIPARDHSLAVSAPARRATRRHDCQGCDRDADHRIRSRGLRGRSLYGRRAGDRQLESRNPGPGDGADVGTSGTGFGSPAGKGCLAGEAAALALGAGEGQSVFAFPVGVSGDAVAVLLLTFARRTKIASADLRLLETIAAMIGLAILRDSYAETVGEAGSP